MDSDFAPGPFVKAVRQGKVKGPQQREFDVKAWAVAAAPSISYPSDALLCVSGIWFAGLFSGIRKMTDSQAERAALARPTSLEAVIAAANREWVVMKKMMAKALAENDTFMFEHVDQIRLNSSSGNPLYFSTAIDTLVDGLKYPLMRATSAPSGAARELSDAEWAAHVEMVALGGYYYAMEQYWMHCVWNCYGIDSTGDHPTLRPFWPDFHRAIAVSNYRRNARAHERAMLGGEIVRVMKDQGEMGAYTSRKRVFSVYKKSGIFRIKVDFASRFPDTFGSLPTSKEFVFEPHMQPLFDNRYAALEGLSIRQVVDAFDLLDTIPSQLRNYLPMETKISAWIQAKPLIPRIRPEEVVAGFRAALGVSPKQAEFLLRFAIWKPSYRHDLWFSPLLRLDDGGLSFACCALDGINHVRLVDRLASDFVEIRRDVERAFEKYFRDDLIKTIEKSAVGTGAQVLPHAFKPADPAVGDVDVLFRFGGTLWVVETKSMANAFDPLEQYSHYELLAGTAVPQVQRKAAYVRANLAEAASALDYTGDVSELRVCPLVVMSNALLCGYPIDDVPVVDRDILHLYFADGELPHLVYGEIGGRKQAVEHIRFYGNIAEAHANLDSYLLDPPQIALARKCIKQDTAYVRTPGLPTLAIVTYEVEMPVDSINQLIERVSASREGRAPKLPNDLPPQRPLRSGPN